MCIWQSYTPCKATANTDSIKNIIAPVFRAVIGVLTANTDKKERVQSAEVNANLGQASDYIYLLIDTFNKQCDTYGLDFQMVYNGSMEEIYLNNDEEIIDVDINDVENEGQKND